MAKKAKKKAGKARGSIYDRIAQEEETAYAGGGGKVPFWKLPQPKARNQPEKAVIRLFPFVHDGQEDLWLSFIEHWVKKNYLCLGADCPLCEAGHKPRKRYLANAILRAHPDFGGADTHIKFQLATKLKNKIARILVGKDSYANALDPKKGLDIKVVRSGVEMNETDYEAIPVQKRRAIGMQVEAEDLVAFHEALRKSPEELEQVAESL